MSETSTHTHGMASSDLNVDLTERADLRRYLDMIGRDYVPATRPENATDVTSEVKKELENGQDFVVLLYVIAGTLGLFATLGVWLGGGSMITMIAAFATPAAAPILHQVRARRY